MKIYAPSRIRFGLGILRSKITVAAECICAVSILQGNVKPCGRIQTPSCPLYRQEEERSLQREKCRLLFSAHRWRFLASLGKRTPSPPQVGPSVD